MWLGLGPRMPPHSISWKSELVWGSKTGNRPAQGMISSTDRETCCMLSACPGFQVVCIFLKNLRADKGFISAPPLLKPLKLWLRAEPATWLASALHDQEQSLLGLILVSIPTTAPTLSHPGVSPQCCNHCSCCRSHSPSRKRAGPSSSCFCHYSSADFSEIFLDTLVLRDFCLFAMIIHALSWPRRDAVSGIWEHP